MLLHDRSEVRFRGEGDRKVRYSSFKRSYFWVGIGGVEGANYDYWHRWAMTIVILAMTIVITAMTIVILWRSMTIVIDYSIPTSYANSHR